MKKFNLLTGVIIYGLSTVAASAMPQFLSKMLKENKASIQSTVIERETKCTDFSGKWSGQCTLSTSNENITEKLEVVIEQYGCHSVNIDNETYTMGILRQDNKQFFANGKYGLTTTYPTTLSSYKIDWNESQDQIEMTGSSTMYPISSNDDIVVIPLQVNLSLDKQGKLVQSLSLGSLLSATCSYDKE